MLNFPRHVFWAAQALVVVSANCLALHCLENWLAGQPIAYSQRVRLPETQTVAPPGAMGIPIAPNQAGTNPGQLPAVTGFPPVLGGQGSQMSGQFGVLPANPVVTGGSTGNPAQLGQPTFQIGPPISAPAAGDPFQLQQSVIQGGSPNVIMGSQFPTGVTAQPGFQPGMVVGPVLPSNVPQSNLGLNPGAGGMPAQSFGNSAVSNWPNQTWARLQAVQWHRLLERPRFRYTNIFGDPAPGDPGNELSVQDVEVATTINFPNFVYSGLPLRVSPGFVLNLWQGPDMPTTGFDLPSQAYSAYFAFDYLTPINRQAGAELNFTIGVYTDFNHVTSDSIRLTGVGLGWWRINNTTTAKLGIEYLDRVDVKLLPAAGVFFVPSPNLKIDAYFPRPRLAARIPNWGNTEVWAYLGGEYGGGSWTVRRLMGPDVISDRIDINDLRVFTGLEWLGPTNVTGFFEVGYVFDREVVFVEDPFGPDPDPLARLKIEDAFMLRAGISF